jgi:uncharacterized protein (DUF302 family)
MMPFGIRKTVPASFDTTLANVRVALGSEGFGVITEIDLQDTFKRKLGVEFRPYRILGACNPTFAHDALGKELELGLVLPCNVIVYEVGDRETVVLAIDPTRTIAMVGNPELAPLAATVKDKLALAMSRL